MSLGTEKQGLDFHRQLLERTRSLPGVESASLAGATPLRGGNREQIEIEGRDRAETGQSPCVFNIITPDYFNTLRIAILEGRVFSEQDRAGASPSSAARWLKSSGAAKPLSASASNRLSEPNMRPARNGSKSSASRMT
jgi:hypothetical protein